MKPWQLAKITLRIVQEQRYEVAVLPIGSCEPHGLHLPYNTDAFEAEMIAERICNDAWERGARVILLPCIPYGVNSNLLAFPFTIHIQPTTLYAFITDIIRSLEHHGIRKIVLFNGHGGNELKPLLRELYGHTSAFLCVIEWWKVASDIYPQLFTTPGNHAGEMETSVCLELFPELVHLEWAEEGRVRESRFEAINREWVQITRPWERLTVQATHGDPRQATREKGKQLIDVLIERLSQFLVELSESPLDASFPY